MFTLNDLSLCSGDFLGIHKIIAGFNMPAENHIHLSFASLGKDVNRRRSLVSDGVVRKIRDLRKSGVSIKDIAYEVKMEESKVSSISIWNKYRSIDFHLKEEYLSSYGLRVGFAVKDEHVQLIVKMRAAGVTYARIGRELNITSTVIRDACQGRLEYLQKYYDSGFLKIESADRSRSSFEQSLKMKKITILYKEKIRQIRNDRYNGKSCEEIAEAEELSLTRIYQITSWNSYWDVDPELKDQYKRRYKSLRKEGKNAA